MTTASDRIGPYHRTLFTICFLGTVFAGLISTLMSVYLPVAVKDLLGNKSNDELNRISAYINSLFIFGAAAGGFICGWISDRFGRKPGVILSIASYGLFTLLTAWMPEWWGVVICRFLSGFGLGGILVTGTTIMIEDWPAKTRSIFIGILSIAIPVGIFSAGLIQTNVADWRSAFYIGLAPLLIAFAAFLMLRETTSWKSSREQNRQTQFQKSIVLDGSFTKKLFAGSIIFGSMLIGLWAIFLWLPTWIQTLVIAGDGQNERGLSMMMLGIGGLTGGFLSGWLMNATGVRKSLLLCFLTCSIISFLLFKTNPVFSPIVYVEIALLALFFGASQGVLSVYIPGLFPVSVRGTATGFCFNSGRLLTGLAVFFIGILVTALGGYGNSLFIFSLIFMVGLLFTFFTKQAV